MATETLIDKLQQSAHLTADHNAAHALAAAVVEIRKLRAVAESAQSIVMETARKCAIQHRLIVALRDVNASLDGERYRPCGCVAEVCCDSSTEGNDDGQNVEAEGQARGTRVGARTKPRARAAHKR
jgi:hypothetical protein